VRPMIPRKSIRNPARNIRHPIKVFPLPLIAKWSHSKAPLGNTSRPAMIMKPNSICVSHPFRISRDTVDKAALRPLPATRRTRRPILFHRMGPCATLSVPGCPPCSWVMPRSALTLTTRISFCQSAVGHGTLSDEVIAPWGLYHILSTSQISETYRARCSPLRLDQPRHASTTSDSERKAQNIVGPIAVAVTVCLGQSGGLLSAPSPHQQAVE
jgi:hypothetical protein